ncbi:cell division protein FtsL [Candidatus Litorirhabdus singularis]|uniref:cell division protein FtsL n=1 Tax=Candidatus Litorirhabdus singularis TaxID=2518993 RepID=UPI00242C27D0|nr:cell division protein FtsL [Candidatus Litorirhabdus singularis]
MPKAKNKSADVVADVVSLRWLGGNSLLLAGVLLSAVAVIQTTHECRQHYATLQSLQSAEWSMQEVWGQLILQEGAVANHDWVENAAMEQLQMHSPAASDIKVLWR